MRTRGTLLLAIVLLAGCRPDTGGRAALSGTVTFDGQPVDGGAIALLPTDGGDTKAGARIDDGKYIIPAERGPRPGNYRVEIRWQKKTGRKIPSDDPPNLMDETRQVIPEQFNAKSKTVREIKPGNNTLDFDLRTKK